MPTKKNLTRLAGIIVLAVLVGGAALSRSYWLPWVLPPAAQPPQADADEAPLAELQVLKLSPQARENLQVRAKKLVTRAYWKTIQIPGVIVDRPGRSDRGVTSPAVGVVTQVHAFPGDTVQTGDRLFTLRLFSEYLQNTQSELFKATRETELIAEQRSRIEGAARSGAIAEARVIELDNQLRRQTALIQAYRQDLLTRGLTPEQIDGVTEGTFVTTVEVVTPPHVGSAISSEEIRQVIFEPDGESPGDLVYEVQDLDVGLGQQVQAGQLLATLANHSELYIEGHAFKQDAPALARAAERRWPLQVEFAEDDRAEWPELDQKLEIRHLANSIDAVNRTFDFFVPLTNQARGYQKDGQEFVVWRFRPGQRVRLLVPIEELPDVIVLPAEAVVREGPEAYVFRQNGDLFDRRSVHVLHEDRLNVVIAPTEGLAPGVFLAQNAAASLNRVLKAQAASGERADVHVHPDGSVHGAH